VVREGDQLKFVVHEIELSDETFETTTPTRTVKNSIFSTMLFLPFIALRIIQKRKTREEN
jgi:hypothetical protein